MLLPLLAAAVAASAATPVDLPHVVVIGQRQDAPSESTLEEAELREPAPADLAALLRAVNGVDAGRMGGHGLEPVIRGQQQGQLNLRLDGMAVMGACPNRMDPPTAHVEPAASDRVRVLKGVQTLRHGAGGTGGTVLVERGLPWREPGVQGRVGLAAGDNGLQGRAHADLGWRGERAALRLLGSSARFDDYVDGAGRTVRSSFEKDALTLMGGLEAGETGRLELTLDHADTRDVLFAGAGMDAPEDRLQAARVAWQQGLGAGTLRASAWRADVEHVMDNFSLRPVGAMAMRVPSTSDSSGGSLEWEGMAGGWEWVLGVDAARNQRLAIRYAGMSPAMATTPNAFMWPDVDLRQVGVFAEAAREVADGTRLRLGLRHDEHRASAALAGVRPTAMAPSPAMLWAMYHGAGLLAPGATDREDGVSAGLLRVEHDLGEDLTAFAGLSRTGRVADATERYLAANNASAPARWIGNPTLAPERHHQLDAGLAWRTARRSASLLVYVDDARDWILRDRARGQDGVLLADGATTYRNVDARLIGVELEAGTAIGAAWRLRGQLAWTRGENRGDGRALAQIAPLSGRIELAWTGASGEWRAVLRGAARQDRVDASVATGSGLDVRQTPGWGALDLGWSRAFGDHRLRVGLDNVFDRLYAEHLNRASTDPFNPEAIQVDEPGRTLSVGWEMRF